MFKIFVVFNPPSAAIFVLISPLHYSGPEASVKENRSPGRQLPASWFPSPHSSFWPQAQGWAAKPYRIQSSFKMLGGLRRAHGGQKRRWAGWDPGSDCTVSVTDRDITSASGDFYRGNRLVLLW